MAVFVAGQTAVAAKEGSRVARCPIHTMELHEWGTRLSVMRKIIFYPRGSLFLCPSVVPIDDVDQLPRVFAEFELKLAFFVDD